MQQQMVILWQYNPPNNVKHISVIESRYRRTDGTLIIVMQEKLGVIITNSSISDNIV